MNIKARTRAERTLARLTIAGREAIVDERTRRLAARTHAAPSPLARQALLAIEVGANLYGLPLTDVAGVRRYGRRGAAPAAAPAVLALTADAGRVRPVIDLPTLLGASPAQTADGWLVVLAAPHNVALRLDAAPASIEAEAPPGSDEGRARVVSAGDLVDRTLVILSVADLLATLSATPQTGASSS
jgi:chemotaxis signal transduction protein